MPYDGEVKNGKIYQEGPQGWGWYNLSATGGGTQGPGTTNPPGDPNDPPVGTTKPGPGGTTLVYLGYGNWDLYKPPAGPAGPAPPAPNAPAGSQWVDQGNGYLNLVGPDGSIWDTKAKNQADPTAPPPAIAPSGSKWVDQGNGYTSLTGPDGKIYDTKAAGAAPPTSATPEVTDMGGGLQLIVIKDQNGNIISSQVTNKDKKPVTSVSTTSVDVGGGKAQWVTKDQDGNVIFQQIMDKGTTPAEDFATWQKQQQLIWDHADAVSKTDYDRQKQDTLDLAALNHQYRSQEAAAQGARDLARLNMQLAAEDRRQAALLRAQAVEAQKNRDFTASQNLLDRALQHELQAERITNEQTQGNLNRASSLKEAAMALQQRAGEVLAGSVGKDPFRFALEARGQATGTRETPVTQFQDKLRTMVNAPLPNIPAAGATLEQSTQAYNEAAAFPTTLPVPTGFGMAKGGVNITSNQPVLALVGEEGPEAALLAPPSAVEPLHMKPGSSVSKMEKAAMKALPKLHKRLGMARGGEVIPADPLLTPNPLITNDPRGPYTPDLPSPDYVPEFSGQRPRPIGNTPLPIRPVYGSPPDVVPLPGEAPIDTEGGSPSPNTGTIGIRDMPFYQILLKELLGPDAAGQILGNNPYTLNQQQLGAMGVSPNQGPTTKLSAFQPYGSLLTLPGQNNAPIPVAFKWAGIFKNMLPDEKNLVLSALKLSGGSGATEENALAQIAAATFTGPGR